ncbi:sperm-associated microtubule inner protein 4 [Conger conger]|uniref:sperm-associated microtubule inner protein 4 n=1 Tax=Conger conger TaxID=82655 RepID=UPI002A59BE1C|nr:sperm-associated microtubule inner protein 4 [Conger conger]
MSSRSKYMPAHIRGHNHFSYGGAVIPENVSITEYYDLTSLKKSNLRRNDELVPKPSEIDLTEKVIKVPVQREHPYASHIPRSALFPYSRSSDYASTNAVTLLNKTIGSSCRQEVLLKHTEPRVWPGQQGFYDIPKQMAGVRQVFYPAPPKITCPNPSLSARETALSAQNFHMFQNWERSRCHTAYQREYSGSRSLTRFDEKTTDITTEDGTPSTVEKRPLVASGCVAEMRPSVLELQDSYSKSDMRRDFYKSTNEAMVDLRDNMRRGKRPRSHYYCNHTAVPLPVA